jgi:superfamily II DNA or RNA helicase
MAAMLRYHKALYSFFFVGAATGHCAVTFVRTGKTLTASVWAKAFHKSMKAHIVVICPISVQHEWQRTFEQAIGLNVQDLNQKKSKKKITDKDETRPAVTIYSWAKVPCVESLILGDDSNQKFVVIADECHSIQSMQAARTQATLKLVLHSNCVGVMMLSGTPMKNGKVRVIDQLHKPREQVI